VRSIFIHWEGFMHRAFVVAASVAAVIWAGTAAADPPRLKGSYGFTGTADCLVAPGNVPGTTPLPNPTPGVALPNSGFKPNLQPNDSGPGLSTNSFTRSHSVEGIRTFNGDGTGTVKGTAVGVVGRPTPGPDGFPHFPPSADAADFSFSFTYVVNPDGSWTGTMVPGSYTETFTAGPRAGQTGTVDAIPAVSGMISQDRKTLIAAHLTPTVETHTFSNGDVDPQICHRSRVFIKLQGSDDDDQDR
jgi:hypothetical protein